MDGLSEAVRRNLAGEGAGVVSFCTAHPEVIRAVCKAGAGVQGAVLIEATCNQVNQEGGYTGLRPHEFRRMVETLAASAGLPSGRLALGGDHLGPNPWRALPAETAMERAGTMIQDYARAGFRKLHLDASMRLGDDPEYLVEEVMAERAAALCAIAESAAGDARPVYVIGTEVPVPGGETHGLDGVRPTAPGAVGETFERHRRAFARRGLEQAFERVIGIVAQPGVDFSAEALLPFAAEGAARLGREIAGLGQVAGEAHSTDYQPLDVLGALVRSHFAILKVGPELTAAYRRAMVGLAHMEEQIAPPSRRSGLVNVLRQRMAARPADWQPYYKGDALTVQRMQLFSYSDRVRYYWPDPAVAQAVARLTANLDAVVIPGLLFEQYLPDLACPREGRPAASVACEAVAQVARRYHRAAGSFQRASGQAADNEPLREQ